MIIPLLVFLGILSFLVFIHELGHFWTAKKFGIGVEEFGMGLPPRAWGKKIGDTIYSINWLPLGGFVKIKGEDLDGYDPNDSTNFMNKHPWKRSVVLVAGVTMNLIFAVTVFYAILGLNGWKSFPLLLLNDYQFKYGEVKTVPNIVTFLEEDSPALKANIQFGDIIYAMEFEDQVAAINNVDDVRNFLSDKADKEIIVKTKNINTEKDVEYKITPAYYEEIGQPGLGVSMSDGIYLDYSTMPLLAGFQHSMNIMGYTFSVMGDLISLSVEEKSIEPVSQGVSGPIGIFGAVQSVIDADTDKTIYTLLDLSALLSLSLAIMNLLPIPALDGGRLVFVVFEWITGKRASSKIEARAHQVGFAMLILLLVAITFKDVFQYII